MLDHAAKTVHPVKQVSTSINFNLNQAYAIQKASIDLRFNRGESLVGLKMGFTSKAKMEQMGVHDLIWGRLTDQMQLISEAKIQLNHYIHPRAEPEIAFRMGEDINRELSIEQLKEKVDSIAVAIEIIDSRYEDFKFSLEDVIADNCSSTGFVIGDWHSRETPIESLPIQLIINDEVVQSGSSAAILGDPWNSLQAATRLAALYGQPIARGSIILAGAATPAVFLNVGDRVEAHVDLLGKVGFDVI